nr:low temperature requirement protein A [Lactiplantibacillus fabifermentans]
MKGEFLDTAIVYLAIQLLFMYMWWTTARFDPEHMLTTRPYLQYYLLGAILLVLTPFTPEQWQLYLLMGVVFVDFFALLFESNNFNREFKQRHIPFKISESLLERYGQFTMIVLGESIANLVELFEDGLTVKSTLTFLLLIISTMALWWLYYSLMDDIEVNEPNYQGLVFFRGLHINFILFLTLACFFLMELGHHSTTTSRYGYLLSLALTLITLTAMVFSHQNNHIKRRSLLTTGGLFCIGLGLCAFLPRYPMLIVIDGLLITACVYRERNILRSQMTN